jgi:hypothetical protein
VLQRLLIQHGIKSNFHNCDFGSKEVSYPGFCLTKTGIIPGTVKLKAIRDSPSPSNIHEVPQLLGLCNFFCLHTWTFAQIMSVLNALTKKESI